MQTVTEFLTSLAKKGVRLSAEGGQLNCYAPPGTLTNDVRAGILKYKGEILALLEGQDRKTLVQPSKRVEERPREFPLSAGEKGLYILQKLHPAMGAYNVPLCFRINDSIRVDMLAKAWDCVLDQFPILTARVIEKDGELYHRLDDANRTAIEQRSVEFNDDQQLLAFVREQAKQPFDLDRGPLTRIQLFTQNGRKSTLLLTVHHMVFDGSSAMIVLKSFLTFYQQLCEGKPVRLSEILGYHEFVAWETAMLSSPEGVSHANYWQRQLEGELPVFELLPDLPRPASSRFEGKTVIETLPEELGRWVREFSRAHSVPPSVVFLAFFKLLLHRYSNQDDIIVGMPVLGRAAGKFATEVGYFINMVPLRTRCGGEVRLKDFVRKVQGTMLDGLYHSSYPFPLMLEKLSARGGENQPVFQVTYAYQNFVNFAEFASLLTHESLGIENVDGIVQEGESDLSLEIYEDQRSFLIHLKFNAELYAEETIRRLFERYCGLLAAASRNTELFVHEYSILTESERPKLLSEFNATQADYPSDQCIHDRVAEQVVSHPDKTAVGVGGQELTYRQLWDRSGDLALYLQSQGVRPDSLVCVCMERSVEMAVGLLGVLQAGGAYVPLDPDYPDERLAYMLRDSGTTIVLTDRKHASRVSALAPEGVTLVTLDEGWPETSGELQRDVRPHHLAYVIYTSGSTGEPKGVMVEHRNLANLVEWHRTAFGLTDADVTTGIAGVGFDAAAWEIWPSLCVGATLVSPAADVLRDPEALLQWWSQLPVDVSFLSTPLAEFAFSRGITNERLRILLTGGDRLHQLPSRREPFLLVNNYGPTECTVVATSGVVTSSDAVIHIGRPISNTQIYILDAHRQPVPIGVAGEMYIGGASVARGYLHRPELTAERFVADPFSGEAGARMYRTGDLACWREDGTIQYLGRIDTQVKIRGFRIELGEIETRLREHDGVQDCAVIAQGEGAAKQLIAFYRAKETTSDDIVELSNEDLRAHLLRTLPEHMVPAAFVSLAAIPLNPNGKIDRRALSRIDVTIGTGRDYVAPRNETETRLAAIYGEVLGLAAERIGVHDDFFALGGHSLLATQLISKIRGQFEIELPLSVVFEGGSVAQLAECITGADKSEIPSIKPVDRAQCDRLPLSFAQERLWFINQLEPESAGYNVPGAVTIRGELNVDQLEEAFNLIVARHESLRTVFPSEAGQARQQILDRVEFRLERIDLSEDEARQEKARELCQRDAATPFDLANGPLFRGKVIRLADDEHILLLNMHHIVSDGWSLGILIKELGAIMDAFRQGRRPELPELPIQYADYSVWQRQWLEEGGVLEQQLAYWQKKLAGVPESLDLATDHPRPSVQSYAGATHAFSLDARLTGQLKRLAEQQGGTLYMVLLAAFKALLHRYTGQTDICVGTPIANRQYGETEQLIGMFVNTLALRSEVAAGDPFTALLSKVKTTCLEAYEHQDAPFEKVVDLLRPQRNLAMTPLFQIMFILQNVDLGTPDPRIERYLLDSGISKFDLTLELTEEGEGLAGSLQYSTALFKPGTIERMAAHFQALCESIVATPSAAIRQLDYLREAEKRRLLVEFNDTVAAYPKDRRIHDFFAEQVAAGREKTAATFRGESLTYGDLCDRTGELALYLQDLGVGPDNVVGLCLERSLEMMVAILGTVRAGGAYMPLDPDYPDDRLTYMLQDSRATVVLTQTKFVERVRALAGETVTIIALDRDWTQVIAYARGLKCAGVTLQDEVQPHNLCYVIYTSGSTGRPKGVLNEHGALVNRIHWMQKQYQLDETDVVLQKTPYSFDVSVWEFFWPTMTGSSVVFAEPDGHKDVQYLQTLIEEAQVTTLHFVPSMLRSYLENAKAACGSVKRIFASGEALDKQSADSYRAKFPNGVLHNLYGPTEAAIDVTYFDCSQLNEPFVPIGKPIDNIQLYILDAQNQIQPIGVPGELHIAGDGLARGYLNRPELTAEKFVNNPFTPGKRMYKTGDLARWMEDGNIQYLGRIDTQVKIRGFRIELGEIESRLNEHADIQDSAVIAKEREGSKQLVAFYRAKDNTEPRAEELRAHCAETLPEYMVPVAFVSVPAIPLSSNGKADRRALERLDVTMTSTREYVAPRNETEMQLVAIWAEVLGREPETIGVNDNFFEIGGHSLLATQLISRVRTQLGIELPLKAIFEESSVAQLAQRTASASRSEVPEIRPVDRAQALPLSFAQERLWFLAQLEPESAGYNIPGAVTIRGELNIEQLEEAFNLIIARHESLRTVFPSEEGQARQQILDCVEFRLERYALSHEEARELCQRDAATPFDLANGPLLRGKVIQVAADEHILLLNMHHIISDGWSLGVMVNELSEIMEAFRAGRTPKLPELPIQYADYSVWQRQWLEEGGVLEQQLAYWQKKLAGVPESLDLPTDFPRPSVQSFAGAIRPFALDAKLTAQLKQLAEERGATLYMVLLAALNTLLYRYTGRNDLCVGSPIANRQYGQTEGLIGMFVNTLALRSQFDENDTFDALLNNVKATCLEAYEHQDAPFEKVVDALRLQRNLAVTPLFQVMLVLQNIDMGTPDASMQPYALDSGISKFDLTIELTETNEALSGAIAYSTALFRPQTIERMAEHFTALCEAIVAAPAAAIRQLEYLGESEKRRLMVEFNDTVADYPKYRCIHDFFAEQVAAGPERIAASFRGQSLTYQELYDRTGELALYLQSLGVGPDDVVGLCLERSLEMMIAIMGTVRAGGAYMPLDPDYPDDRLTYMLQDSRATVVLTQAKFVERVRALATDDVTIIALDREWPKNQDGTLRYDVQPHNLCYVIYTSGSTGRPKGVLNEHGALVNRIHWMQKQYQLDETDVVLQKTPYSFDVSVWEFFWPMMTGSSVVFAEPDGHKDVQYLQTLIEEAQVTTLHFVPSMLRSYLENAKAACSSVKRIFASGEALDKQSADSYRAKFPNGVLHNLYGPTEAAIDVTYFDCSQLTEPFVPIGKPIDNIQLYILDAQNQLQPIGVPGELHIAGDGLARGYLNRPELTAEKFVNNPFTPGARMYKTGDLARWMEDGNIQYLGRIDTQVKIRGFRIELGEIESRLNEHADIQDSAVIAKEREGSKQLVAFYRAKDNTEPRVEELRAHCAETLPEYMVPVAFVSVPAIPLSSNGKADRRALERLDVTMTSTREYVAPRNETEKQLVAIWAEVLGREPETIGVNDNFFEIGGHSLLATQLISRVRTQLGIELPLKAIFEESSVAQLAQRTASASRSEVPEIRPVDRSQSLPLSFAQERLWFLAQLEPESAGYNIPGAVTIRGELNIDQLEEAFNLIIARHESLRTVFPSEEGQARQQILDRVEFRLERYVLSHEEARELCQRDAATPFDLANGPLLRGKVIQVGAEEHILLLNMHHIISDGWSLGVLVNELSEIMEAFRAGRTPKLPELPIQYADYSVWQRQWLEEGGVLEQQLAYWQKKLAGVPESLDLPTDFPRPSVQSFAGAIRPFALDARLTAQLKQLAEERGATLYMVLLAALNTLLYRYTGRNDLCVGSPIANRQYGQTEGLIGMFVNTLALRSQFDENDTFDALLSNVKATCLEAYEHQDAPFEKVVDALRLQRNLAVTPLFQVMLVLQNIDMGTPDASMQPYALDSGISKFDLTIELTETNEALSGAIAYSTVLFRPQTIERMAEHFTALCEAIVAAPAAAIRQLDYLGEGEKRRLLVEFNDTTAQYPQDRCIHDFFVEQVAAGPDRIAASFRGQSLTYRELYERTGELALVLQSLGVEPDRVVGLCLERSLEMMIAIMGTVRAGGAYMPLDPDYPDDRLTYMMADSKANVVLTQAKFVERVRSIAGEDVTIIALDREWPKSNGVLRLDVQPHNLCYVIYTSGSTGRPKGVLNEHGALVNRIHWMQKEYQLDSSDVVLQKTPYSFDVSVWEFFWPMMTGSSVVFAEPDGHKDVHYLQTLIADEQVTTLHFVPSMLRSYLENAKAACASVKRIFASGEALDKQSADSYRAKFPNGVLHNLYGPTEAAIDVTYFDCSQLTEPFVPIGKPIDNIQLYILDAQNQIQPIGVPGELHIAGDGLARGYLNRPELTAEKFVQNPFTPGARMYKTGDLARWMEDGNIQYLGRIDTQVKIRGFRIELGEIESRLNEHADIQDSAVIAKEREGSKQLVAFYRAKDNTEPRAEELRAHCAETLPEYMVPVAFVSVPAIPLSSNGKADRRALERLDVTMTSTREYVAPRNETEKQLVAIWAEVLGREPETIGVNDNFFEIGGHSLSAVSLVAKIVRRFEQQLPLAIVFTAPSIAAIAQSLTNDAPASSNILIPIQKNGTKAPIFAVPGAGGTVLSFGALALALGEQQPLFGFHGIGLDGKTPPPQSVEETAQAYVEAMKTEQPSGPYHLLGHSYGGAVAYEMARILLEQGEDVASLILLDSLAPSIFAFEDEIAEIAEAFKELAGDADLELNVERLRNSSDRENAEYFVALLNERGLLDVNADQLAALMHVCRVNLMCYSTYQPSELPRPIDVSLYRATEGREGASLPDDYGWGPLVSHSIRAYDVAADHYSILEHVQLRQPAGIDDLSPEWSAEAPVA